MLRTYLGVTIDQHLSWYQHVSNISNKANSIVGFLQRNVSSFPISVKEACYKSMVEYASPPSTKLNKYFETRNGSKKSCKICIEWFLTY